MPDRKLVVGDCMNEEDEVTDGLGGVEEQNDTCSFM